MSHSTAWAINRVEDFLDEVFDGRLKSSLRRPYRGMRRAYRRGVSVLYRGNQVECPCCGWRGRRFLSGGRYHRLNHRPNAVCPKCDALERHRLVMLYIRNKTSILSERTNLLHFAPESALARIFSSCSNIHYVTTDLEDPDVTVRMDITNIQFPDNSFDFVLCSHVLEHVLDDRKAMSEVCRVLRPGGLAILQVPIYSQEQTFEDPSATTRQDRTRLFDHKDHVRKYGRDYKSRLTDSGFLVSVESYAMAIGTEAMARYGLLDEDIYACTKPLDLENSDQSALVARSMS